MSHDDRLQALVARWLREQAAGRAVTPAELCRECPELTTVLEQHIRALAGTTAPDGPPAGREAAGWPMTAKEAGPWPPYVAPASDLAAPPNIPGYEVLGTLGRGGMGVVYRAHHVALNRPVALKMILTGAHAGPEERLRFLAEAKAIAAVKHPGIIEVYELGAHDGLAYFALELCEAGSLADQLAGKPLPPREGALIVEQLARAVQAAHAAGVVHRDLKPGNVLLTSEGRYKVTDFGLAKRLEGASLTRTGAVLGTPAYMPPEQARGQKELGPSADVYALGAILYECLTGRPPFLAASAFDTLKQVLEDDPVLPRQFNPAVPPDLQTVALKCLHKSPERRYPSAGALADDLRRWLNGEAITARPAGRAERAVKWARRRPVAAALLGVSLAAGLSLVGITALALEQRQRAVEALDREREARTELEREQTERALAQVAALRDAAPGAVPRVLADLQANRDAVFPRLRELYAAETDRGRRMRLALALLPVEPEAMRGELLTWMLQAEAPEEVLLFRDGLQAHAGALKEDLWRRANEAGAREARFRALVALAAYDPASPRWSTAGAVAVGELVQSNPLFLGRWVEALRPVRGRLLPHLVRVFRGEAKELADRRDVAVDVLTDYGGADPSVLVDVLLDAEVKPFLALQPVLARHRDQAVDLLRRQLMAQPDYWNDPPLTPGWKEPRADLRREVEQAQGLVAPRFALCQSLPLLRLHAVTEGLRPAGYRPVRVRPWGPVGETLVAVVWARDGIDWQMKTELTPEDATRPESGMLPADVAGYRGASGDRYVAVWRKGGPGEQGITCAGLAEADLLVRAQKLRADGLQAATVQGLLGGDGVVRYAGTWEKVGAVTKANDLTLSASEDAFDDEVAGGHRLLMDVAVTPSRSPGPPRDRWMADLERADRDLKAKPQKFPGRFDPYKSAVYRRVEALIRLGRDAEARPGLEELIRLAPDMAAHYRLRALLHARAGDAAAARADLKMLAPLDENEPFLVARALVELTLGSDAGLKALDEAVEANRGDKVLLVGAARAHALAARLQDTQRAAVAVGLAAPSGLTLLGALAHQAGAKHWQRAAALLEQAIEAGKRKPGQWRTDPDLAPLTEQPTLHERLIRRGAMRAYSVLGRESPSREATGLFGLTPGAHLSRCRELAAQGWRPVGLSLASVPGENGPVAASVWQRPVAAAERLRAARRRAAAGLALLRLGDEGSVWPLLRHAGDPTARSFLLARVASHRIDPLALIRRLDVEKDDSARRALIVALGDYREKDIPALARAPLVKQLLGWYRDDPDPGVHGAIDWLLRPSREGPVARPLDWGQGGSLAKVDRELARRDPDGRRGWFVNGQGDTFSIIRGPVIFKRGSPTWEADRHPANETSHMRVIPRSYALATKAVTVAQWEQFLKDRPTVRHNYEKQYSPEAGGPIIRVGLWEAMQYCNWLSEKEKVPKDQWCYPETIEDGMRPYPDYLRRTGYRLPSESEWEHACRAGASTSWFFGASEELLPRYAWFGIARNERVWPVGEKRPNDLGLFDMHGNVSTWCQESAEFYKPERTEDLPDLGRISARGARVLRGGGYFSPPQWVRSASRIIENPESRFPSFGLRVCRTVK